MDYRLITNASDDSVLVRFEERIDPEIAGKVRQAGLLVSRARLPWVTDIVPAYNELLVVFRPGSVKPSEALLAVKEAIDMASEAEGYKPRLKRIPICYGGAFGPDLPEVSRHTGLDPEQVIMLHSSARYLIYMIGFTIGFPYLGGMDHRLETPRLTVPRPKVPRGSVGIGGKQTGIYPLDVPGGWQIIGRSPVNLVDTAMMPPVLLSAGDYVEFFPIDEGEYSRIQEAVEAGRYSIEDLELGGSQ